ncbi:hypothetical protein PC128_g10349 [Phytophthora cactorum]|nr:hypothetical protein PC128_g10349 [Phytophthora cactorum]
MIASHSANPLNERPARKPAQAPPGENTDDEEDASSSGESSDASQHPRKRGSRAAETARTV